MIKSTTKEIPVTSATPTHIAVIMDGNGRWAKKRFLPRVAGHSKGLEVVRSIVEDCSKRGVGFLTLFAFSSENWRRPQEEVSFLMSLFLKALEREVVKLNKNNIKLRLIGDMSGFPKEIQDRVKLAEDLTKENTGLVLTIAANYGGRWDILQATRTALEKNQVTNINDIDEDWLTPHLSMSFAPEPDLFIRTGGEQRISNFLLWHLAYTELYFSDILWPDFDKETFEHALSWYAKRQRRFGQTGDQVNGNDEESGA
jgi:undecaprenyl diphosphate synthase